jgi:hypothetical protein
MKHCHDSDSVASNDKVDAVGELAEQGAPDWLDDDRKLRRILTNPIESDVDLGHEALSGARIALMVPRQRFVDVSLCPSANDKSRHSYRALPNFRCNSARTSVQGRPSVGSER